MARRFQAHHFICHDEQVELLCKGGNLLQFGAGEYFPNRVVRGIDYNYFGTRSDSGSARTSKINETRNGLGDEADRSSSKSIVQSLLVGFSMSWEGGCRGT